jgi:hypothetical protein
MVRFNPDTPAVRQRNDWTCAICTATFMRNSIGDPITSAEMQDRMASIDDPSVGLHDGSGAQLAAFLTAETGLPSTASPIDWGWLQTYAGTRPIGMGGHRWGRAGHWVAVRKVNADGTIALANPAPGYQGVGDTLTEADFWRFAPFSAVTLDVPAPEEDPLSAEERAELEQLRETKTYCDALTATILPSALGTMEAAAQGSRSKLAAVVKAQCAAVREQAGI